MSTKRDHDEWNLERFEHWIRVGVESYVLENIGPAAFPEAAHLILQHGSLTEGLRIFAQGFNAKRLDNMKQAVAQVLSSLEPQEKYVPVVEQLLAIAVSLSAYPVLKVLASKIGNGFFGQPDPEGQKSLFAMTLYCVARLSTPAREDAKHCLHQLITSDNFRPAYASTALIALCQIDQKGLVDHLSIPGIRANLQQQFALYDPEGKLRLQQQVARQIFYSIGIHNIGDALPYLSALDPFVTQPSPDDWLIHELLYAKDSPLLLGKIDNKQLLYCRDQPEKYFVIPDPLPQVRRVPSRSDIDVITTSRVRWDLANDPPGKLRITISQSLQDLCPTRKNRGHGVTL